MYLERFPTTAKYTDIYIDASRNDIYEGPGASKIPFSGKVLTSLLCHLTGKSFTWQFWHDGPCCRLSSCWVALQKFDPFKHLQNLSVLIPNFSNGNSEWWYELLIDYDKNYEIYRKFYELRILVFGKDGGTTLFFHVTASKIRVPIISKQRYHIQRKCDLARKYCLLLI